MSSVKSTTAGGRRDVGGGGRRKPSKYYRELIAAEVATQDGQTYADPEEHSPVRLLSVRYLNQEQHSCDTPQNSDNSVEYKTKPLFFPGEISNFSADMENGDFAGGVEKINTPPVSSEIDEIDAGEKRALPVSEMDVTSCEDAQNASLLPLSGENKMENNISTDENTGVAFEVTSQGGAVTVKTDESLPQVANDIQNDEPAGLQEKAAEIVEEVITGAKEKVIETNISGIIETNASGIIETQNIVHRESTIVSSSEQVDVSIPDQIDSQQISEQVEVEATQPQVELEFNNTAPQVELEVNTTAPQIEVEPPQVELDAPQVELDAQTIEQDISDVVEATQNVEASPIVDGIVNPSIEVEVATPRSRSNSNSSAGSDKVIVHHTTTKTTTTETVPDEGADDNEPETKVTHSSNQTHKETFEEKTEEVNTLLIKTEDLTTEDKSEFSKTEIKTEGDIQTTREENVEAVRIVKEITITESQLKALQEGKTEDSLIDQIKAELEAKEKARENEEGEESKEGVEIKISEAGVDVDVKPDEEKEEDKDKEVEQKEIIKVEDPVIVTAITVEEKEQEKEVNGEKKDELTPVAEGQKSPRSKSPSGLERFLALFKRKSHKDKDRHSDDETSPERKGKKEKKKKKSFGKKDKKKKGEEVVPQVNGHKEEDVDVPDTIFIEEDTNENPFEDEIKSKEIQEVETKTEESKADNKEVEVKEPESKLEIKVEAVADDQAAPEVKEVPVLVEESKAVVEEVLESAAAASVEAAPNVGISEPKATVTEITTETRTETEVPNTENKGAPVPIETEVLVTETEKVVSKDDMSVSAERREIIIKHETQNKSYTLPSPSKKSSSGLSPLSPLKYPPSPQPSTSQMLAPMHSPNDSYDSAIARSVNSSYNSGIPTHAPGHFVVVAIDFGTTFSGYAFSFTQAPEHIHMMKKWEGGDPGVINQKTPTCLLLTPEGKFHSFGFTARDYYHDLNPEESTKWLFFDKFKMVLHYNTELNKDTELKATNGKTVPALTVFSYALRFFKEHALQELSDQSMTKILNEDVRWVITVPAIWKAPAKQFMRQAAYNANIACPEYPDQLLIALEPEAASIYVRRLRMHQLVPDKVPEIPTMMSPKKEHASDPMNLDNIADEFQDDQSESGLSEHSPRILTPSKNTESAVYPFPSTDTVGSEVELPGTRYMIVDCGGGTVDITVHEMEYKHGNLKELYKATGGPYGSMGVDLKFEQLLIDIFGSEFIEAFKYKRPAGWVDLMIAFESRKRAASPYRNTALNVSLPFSFIDYYKKYKGSQVEAAIRKYGDKDIRWSAQGMLRLHPDAMRNMFSTTIDRIKASVGDVLNKPEVKEIRYMFLVGGFAESQILQYEMRKEFGHLLKILIPQDVALTILKGAVCFGLDPTVVNVRRSRVTYGVGVLNRFVPDKHPPAKKVSKDGIDWCTDVFDKFVVVDQPVALGDTVLRSYTPAKPGQTSSIINIYQSEKSDVKFITDEGVSKVGSICLDLSDVAHQDPQPKRREIQTRMIFGDTEIKISALDVASGKCMRSKINFLC